MPVKTTSDKILTSLLTPLSWIYGAVVWVRNKLFDVHIFKENEFDVPVIGVGNITVGGTGKTPHTEYIVGKLCSSLNVAVLSRGYKRKTKGFIVANSKSTPDSIGDEPWQIYNKFGMKAKVAVCESRTKGITRLLQLYPEIDLIVLDDSFQHRWVKPRVSILLMEYDRPVYRDHLLPLGRLRESPREICRADKVIVTKCPMDLSPIDFRITIKELDLMKFQKLYFSRYKYEALRPVFPDEAKFTVNLSNFTAKDSLFLLTGIAHPHYFVRNFRQYSCRKKVEHFPDHHDFTRKDVKRIAEKFNTMKGERKIIVTTEKDAVRLVHNPYFPTELKPYVFYQPISVEFVASTYEHDNDLITDLLSELRLEGGSDVQDTSGYSYYPDSVAPSVEPEDNGGGYDGGDAEQSEGMTTDTRNDGGYEGGKTDTINAGGYYGGVSGARYAGSDESTVPEAGSAETAEEEREHGRNRGGYIDPADRDIDEIM